MSGLHAREYRGSKIDVTHPFRATVALLIGALVPPAAILLAGHDPQSAPVRLASVMVPDQPIAEGG
ncbi:hypothetical protein ACFY1P_20470 [Streptomyces sp. NPDC001407]|uniref:hypothetical protein n=1 Tax=Streptomyces sp. NPDC001407 TaxID=3364573 RepID=UPI003675B5C4